MKHYITINKKYRPGTVSYELMILKFNTVRNTHMLTKLAARKYLNVNSFQTPFMDGFHGWELGGQLALSEIYLLLNFFFQSDM